MANAKAKRGSSSYQETGAARAVVAAYQEEVEKAKQAANTAGTGVDYKTVNRQAYETAYNSNAAYRQQVNDNASAILSKYINDDGSWKENTQIDRDMAALNNTAKNQEVARQQRQAQQLQSLKDLIAQATESEGRQSAIRTAIENKDTDLQGAIDQYDKALKASKRTSAAVDELRKELQDIKGKQSTVRSTRATLPKQTEDTADLGRITSAADIVDRNRVAAAKGEAAQTASKLNEAISKMNAAYQSYAKATSSNEIARTQMNYQSALRAYIDALDANNSAQAQYASLTNLFQAQEDYAQAHPAETRKILETARGIGVSGSTRTGQPIRNSQTALDLQNAAAALDNYGKARVQELLGATQRGTTITPAKYEAYRKNVEAAAALEAQAKAKLKEADKYLKSDPAKFKKLQKEADKLQTEAEGYRAKADEISGGDASFAQQGEAASMAADAKADPDFKFLSEAGEKRTFVPRLRSMSGQAESVREQNDWQTRSITGSNTTVQGYIDAMTEEQRKVYYYYVGRGETDKAQEYFSALEPSLETGYSAAMTERMQGIAEEHPVAMTGLTAVLNNTAAPVQGVIAAAQNVANKDKWAVPMTAGAGYSASDTAKGTQQGVSADIQKATGFSENTSDFLSGVILSTATSIVGSQLWGNVYGAALTSGITGGAVVPAMNETIPLVVMGTEAFSEAYREQIRDGKDPAYSLLYSGAAGYVEYLTEKIGMDDLVNGLMSGGSATRLARRLGLGLIDVDGRLVSTAKSSIVRTLHTWLVGSASSALSEGGEEILSEAADTILDVVLNGDRSEMGKQFNAYLAEGDDANVALRKCFKDFGLNIAEAFAGGAISGGIMSIPGIFSSASNSNALGQAVLDAQGISGNALNWAEYVSEALTMNQNTRTYQIAKQIYDADQAMKNYMPSASEMTNLILASKVDAEQAARSQAKLDKIQARELRRTEQAEAKAARRSGGSKTSTQVTDLGEIGTQVKNLGVDAKTAQNVERMMSVVHSGESLTDANIRSLPLNNTKVMEYVADLLGYGSEIKDIGTFRAAVQNYNDTHETTTAQAETARNMISQVNESMPTIKKAAYDRADTEAAETLRTAQQAATQAAEQARQARTTQAQNAAVAMGARVQSQAAQIQAEAKTTETATEPEGVKHRAKAAGYNYGDFSELMQSFHPDMGSDEIVKNFNDVADGKKTLLDVIGRDGIRKFAEEAAGRSVTDEEVDQIAAAYALSGEDGTNIRQSLQEQLDHIQEQGKRGFRYSKENPNLLAEWMVDRVKRNLFEGYDVNVEVRYDLEDGAGNGYYDAGTNTIVINGQIREGRHGGVTYNAAANLTYVVSHEFFHRYLNPTSAVKYTPEIRDRMDNVLETYRQARGWAQNDLDNFVQRHFETYMAQARKDQRRIKAGESGESVENALNPDKITLDYAREESAADLGAEMLQNYGVMKRMASVGPTFLEALKNSMTAARQTIQSLVQKGDDADAVLGQQTLDGVDMIMSMLDDVLPERAETVAIHGSTDELEEASIRQSVVEDPDTLDFLNNQEYVTVYRAMQEIDGKLYPPMAAMLKGEDGKLQLVDSTDLETWYQADERPDLVLGDGKFRLYKGNGTYVDAAYNPYWHTSKTMLNDQFSSAYARPNLVVVEGRIPVSELTSGYRAEGAKDAVGETEWHSGPVSGDLNKAGAGARTVYLSRWFQGIRVVPDAEVAASIAGMLEGTNVAIPTNVVTPTVLEELERLGVPTITSKQTVDQAYLDEIANGNMDVVQRMANDAAQKAGITGSVEAVEYNSKGKPIKLSKRFPDAFPSKTKQKSGNVRYSISEDINGDPYVLINTNRIFSSDPDDLNQNRKQLANILKEQFPDGIIINGSDIDPAALDGSANILRNRNTAREIAQGKVSRYLLRDQRQTVYTDKLGMAAESLDEIIQAVEQYNREGPEHPRRDDIIAFHRGTFRALINGRGYEAAALIAEHDDRRLTMYDIVDMKPTTIKEKIDSGSPDAPSEHAGGPNGRMAGLDPISSISDSDDSVNRRFNLDDPIEDDGKLIAAHNLTERNLLDALELGGLPMPSIAIVKSESGHTQFGPITLLFAKNTIDPQADRRNKVYGGDAWTPTAPQVDYMVNTDEAFKFDDQLYEWSKQVADGIFANSSVLRSRVSDNYTNYSIRDLAERLSTDSAVKAAYLAEHGQDVEPVRIQKEFDQYGNDYLQTILDTMGVQEVAGAMAELEQGGRLTDSQKDSLREIYRQHWIDTLPQRIKEKRGPEQVESRSREHANDLSDFKMENWVRHAWEYYEDGGQTKTEIDRLATANLMNSMVTQNEVIGWLEQQLQGVIGERGLYNGKDPFTASGNRRSFWQLHYEYTLENIVRAMKGTQTERGQGLWGATPTGLQSVASPEYRSIDEIRADSGRLGRVSETDYAERVDALDAEIQDVIGKYLDQNTAYGRRDSFGAIDSAGSALIDIAKARPKSVNDVIRSAKKLGDTVNTELATQILNLVNEAATLPTEYFEAKPQRAVGLDEIVAAIIPESSSDELRTALKDHNIEAWTYDQTAWDNSDRKVVTNSVAGFHDVRFSLDDQGRELSPQQAEYFKDSAIRDDDGNLITVYHGTDATFTVFDLARSGANYDGWSQLGEGMYFTPDQKWAQYFADNAGRGRDTHLMEGYLNITNPFNDMEPVPFEIDDLRDRFDLTEFDVRMLRKAGYRLIRFLQEHDMSVMDYLSSKGHDGVWDKSSLGLTQIVAYSENQFKNQDNLEPTKSVDIRFSLDDLDDDADSAFAMYTQNGVTNRAETGSDFISYDGSLSTARDFKRAFGSEIDTDYLAMRLRQMGEQWDEIADLTARMGADGISEDEQNRLRELYDTTERMETELAGEIADNGTLERNQGFDQALYQYMRESVENGIRVPPDQANNYAEALGYENYTEMRKGLYGPFRKNVRLVASGSGANAVTTAGEAADVLFENILNEFPGAFSEEERGAMNPADRFAAIYNAYMRTIEARDARANPLAGRAGDIAQTMTSAFSDRMVQVASSKYDTWRLEQEIAKRTAQETEAKRLANQARQVQRQANESDDPELSRQASDLREQAEAARVESLTTDEALQEGLDESGLETMTREQAAKAYLENEAELVEHRKAQNAEKSRSTNWNTMTPQERADAVVRQIMDRKNAAPRQRTSKVYSNTYDAVLGEVNMQIDELQANSTYDVASEKQSIAGAVQNVKSDYTYWYETLPTKDGWGAQDLDTAMLILTRVQAESQRTGDNTEYIRWAKIIKEHGTQGGQFLQAFAKWSRSAAAVAVAGTKIIEDTTLSVSADTDVLEGIQNAIDSTQLTVDQYQARYQDLMKQLAEKKAQLEALLAQKAESKTMDEQARKELEKSKKKLQDTIAQIDKYRVQYETHLKEIEKFQASIAEKLMEKSELSAANKKLMRKLQNLKHRASSLENRINEISGINDTLTNAVQSGNLEDMIRRLEARLDALKLSADQAAADRNAAAAAEQRTGHKRKQSERNKLATETTSDVINSENREFLDILDSIVSDPVKQELMSNMIDMAKMIDACSEGDKEAMLDIIEQTLIKRGFKRGISDHMKKRFLKQDFNYLSRYAVSAMVSMAYDVTPRTWAEKASSIQYTAQLGSPKTWLRNVFSNTAFYLTEGIAKMPASFLDMVTAKAVQGLTKSANASRTVGHAGFTGGTDVIRSGMARAGQSSLEVRYDVDTGTMKNKYLQNPRKGEAVRDILGSAVGRRTFKMNNGMAPTKNIFKNGARAIGRAISVREMINGYALNVTDEFSKGMIYESMMRQYEALGIVDENNANGRIDRETAEALAAQEMLYATFQDETWLGTILDAAHNLLNANKPDGRTAFGPGDAKPHQFGAGDFAVKYRGVPGALVTRGLEFTPLGAAYALYNLHAFHKSGYTDAVRQYKWVMGMGRALTGSAIAAFFLLLAKLGLVSRPDDEEDKDIAAQDRAAGINGTQINWTAFGRVIDQWQAQRDAGVDWKDMKFDQLDTAWQDDDQVGDIGFMDPLAANITLGVEALRLLEDNSLGASSIGASIKTVWDAFSDLSMMDTIQDLVYAIQYYGDDPSGIGRLWGAGLTFAASSATSMIPATVRQIAQGLDNNYRDTSSTNGAVYEALKDMPLIGGERTAKSAQNVVYNVMSTIPGLRSQVPVKTDSYGQPKTYSGDAEPTTADRIANLLNATLNPGRHTKLNISEVYAETRRLYKETGISAVPDRKAPTSESFSGTDLTVKLTGEDREQWMTEVGNRSQEIMLDLMRTDEYKAATDAQKVEMLRDAKNYAAYEGKKALYEKYVTDGSTWSTDTYSKIDGILDLDNPNLNYAAAYRIKNEINGLEADRDSEGETIEGSLENKILDRMFQYEQDYNLDDNTLVDLYQVTRGSASESATNKMRTLINDAGLTFDEIIDIKTAYNTINATGEAGGMKEVDQFARYLRNEGYTDQQMAAIQEQYKYWTMMPQKESSTIAKLTEAGTDYDVAYDYAAGLAQLEPEEGKDSVSKAQKYQYVLQNVTDANDRQALFQALSEGDTTLLNKIDTGLANKLIDGYAATGSTTFVNINPSNSMTMDKVEYTFSESDMEKYNEAVLNAYAGIANDSISANEQVFDVFRNAAYGAGQVAALANQGNVWSVDDILESGSTASNNMKHYARATIAASQGLDYYEYATCYREVLDAKDVWTKDNNMGYSTEKSYIQSLLVSEYGSSVGNYLYNNVFYRS